MTLIDCFFFIPNLRQDYKVKYFLTTLLFTTLRAVLRGCQNWLEIVDCCDATQKWLSKYIDLSSEIPFH